MTDKPIDPVQFLYAEIEKNEIEKIKRFKRSPMRFRASEAADCSRKIWYRLTGHMPVPRSAFLELVSQSGNIHHDFVRHLLHLYGVKLHGLAMNEDGTVTEDPTIVREFEKNGQKFTVSGRSDGGIDVQIEDEATNAVLEIKSIGAWKYRYINEAFEKGPQEIYDYIHKNCKSYVYQGTVMALLQDKDYVYLLLVNRDNMTIGLFSETTGARHGGLQFKVDEELREQILSKFARIQKMVYDGTPPPPEFTQNSTECKQCDFMVYCHGARTRREKGIKPYVQFPVEGLFTEVPE